MPKIDSADKEISVSFQTDTEPEDLEKNKWATKKTLITFHIGLL